MSDADTRDTRRGGCQCGQVRYELSGPALQLFVCHCRECRKQSASAFGISVFVASAALRLVHGVPKFWSRPTDSGNVLHCAFCPTCGSRLWHERSSTPETVSIKGGSLDDATDLSRAVHIWTSRKLEGVVISEGSVQFEREPHE